jgi:small-conductance mechanosensitive channel
MEKDYEIEGKIIDIGLFFTILHTADNEQIDIPIEQEINIIKSNNKKNKIKNILNKII